MKATVLAIYFITLCFSVCAADRPRLRDVTTVPRFDKRDDATHLLIDDGKKPIEILWSFEFRGRSERREQYQYFPVTLATDVRYTFTIEEQQYPTLEELEAWGLTIPSVIDPKEFMNTRQAVVRISHQGTVLYDREVCEIHRRKMQRIDAPIIYGLIRQRGPQPTLKQTQTQFPHYREESFGGCAVMREKTQLMFVCQDCKAAHEKWEKDQTKTTR